MPLLVRLMPLVLALIATAAWPDRAGAAFPGDNGKLAYGVGNEETFANRACTRNTDGTGELCLDSRADPAWSANGTRLAVDDLASSLYTVNPDGTGETQITNTEDEFIPAWSPDGLRIAFTTFRNGNFDIYLVDADGTNLTPVTTNSALDFGPAWSPDGQWISFYSDRDGNDEIYKVHPNGTGATRLTTSPGSDTAPNWSPDGAWLTFESNRDGDSEVYKARADGTEATRVTNNPGTDRQPAWSPDGTRIAYSRDSGAVETINPDGTGRVALFTVQLSFQDAVYGVDWQPLARGYVRPKGASPMRLSLVPAAKTCASPNRTHGSPLASPSCSPPTPGSSTLTLGVGDGTPPQAKSIGSVSLKVVTGDLGIDARITNVIKRSDGSDYTGELRLELPLRITDRFNRPSPSGTGPGTVSDTSFFATVSCTATFDTTLGAACALTTTADALLPGTVRAGARAIWGLGQIRLHDGGPDGDAETPGDNELLAAQGVFIP